MSADHFLLIGIFIGDFIVRCLYDYAYAKPRQDSLGSGMFVFEILYGFLKGIVGLCGLVEVFLKGAPPACAGA